ncbi:MAG: hypothetical protein AAGC99_14240 [Pseudomonadota bacterium]
MPSLGTNEDSLARFQKLGSLIKYEITASDIGGMTGSCERFGDAVDAMSANGLCINTMRLRHGRITFAGDQILFDTLTCVM